MDKNDNQPRTQPWTMHKIAITGINGYLGSHLARFFQQQGFTVYGLSSSACLPCPPNANQELLFPFNLFAFNLAAPPGPKFFSNEQIKILIHCAYDFTAITEDAIESINVRGSLKLMKAAKAGGVEKIIFISSMAAFANCQSIYGQAKLKIENEALKSGAIVVRPGLIFSDEPGAMMAKLVKAVQSLPVLPDIIGGQQNLYLVHMTDLIDAIYQLATKSDMETNAPIIAASKKSYSLRQIFQTIAKKQNKQLIFFPIHWRLIWLPLKILELLGIKLPFRSDSLVSIANADLKPDFTTAKIPNILFREFD